MNHNPKTTRRTPPPRPPGRPPSPSRPRPPERESRASAARDRPRPAEANERYSASATPTPLMPMPRFADAAVEIAHAVERSVFHDHEPPGRALSESFRELGVTGELDRRIIARAGMALVRWHGWLEPLRIDRTDERLLIALLLDLPEMDPLIRQLARKLNRATEDLSALGNAPGFAERALGLKRMLGGRAINADPWRLFPDWLRPLVPMLPGEGSAKFRTLGLLDSLQRPPAVWIRAVDQDPDKLWSELRQVGHKPWVHRHLTSASRLAVDVDLDHLPAWKQGRLEIQDLCAQAAVAIADPDPGERWWIAGTGDGTKALQVCAHMNNKGVVIASDESAARLEHLARRARARPFCNMTTRLWDGKHAAGKSGSCDGVIAEPPSSAIGTWRRCPERRWLFDPAVIPRLIIQQAQALDAAAIALKVGGTLIYCVATINPSETQGAVASFLARRPNFQAEGFSHPLRGGDGGLSNGRLLITPSESEGDALFVAKLIRLS